jgi:hypothetical protein
LVQKRPSVARSDNNAWSLYEAQRAQPVASGGKRNGFENASKTSQKTLDGNIQELIYQPTLHV